MQYLISVVLLLITAVAVLAFVNRPERLIIDAELPHDFPAEGFSHASFEAELRRYVDTNGNVDYDAWHASAESLQSLRSYLAAVSRFSPDNSAQRFSTRSDELAYWIYAYNAHVIHSVLSNWPIDSVTDVQAPIEVIKGLGFFHRQRFEFGGEYLSLLSVENNRIRKRYSDPRIHFALNCASESCPVLRPELPVGDALEAFLARAAHDFVANPANVSVDHEQREILLSTIFKWYKKDFVNHMRLQGSADRDDAVPYIRSLAPPSLQADLDRAGGYAVRYSDYDWTLNSADR